MLRLTGCALAFCLLSAQAFAQPTAPEHPEAAKSAPVEPTAAAEPTDAPAEPPPLPRPDEDFSADRDTFKEVETAPEARLEVEAAESERPVETGLPLYKDRPVLALVTQAAAGVFAAGAVGLFGGVIGEAIDAGDGNQPLGGLHGPAVGGFIGASLGSALGVMGAGMLFEKTPHWGYTALGLGTGTLLGAGAAFGIATAGDEGETAAYLAVGTFLALQIGGTMLFSELSLPEPVAAVAPAPVKPLGPQESLPTPWLFPVISRAW